MMHQRSRVVRDHRHLFWLVLVFALIAILALAVFAAGCGSGEETTTTAEQILSDGVKGEEKNRLDEAKEFLESNLSGGAVLSATLIEQARAVSIGGRTLWRAKKELKIKARKQFGNGAWEWSLPTT